MRGLCYIGMMRRFKLGFLFSSCVVMLLSSACDDGALSSRLVSGVRALPLLSSPTATAPAFEGVPNAEPSSPTPEPQATFTPVAPMSPEPLAHPTADPTRPPAPLVESLPVAWPPASDWWVMDAVGREAENGPVDGPGGVIGDMLAPTSAYLSKPAGVAMLPGGRLLVLDRGHGLLRVVEEGVLKIWAGRPDGTQARLDKPVPAREVRLQGKTSPGEIATALDGTVWIVDGEASLLVIPPTSGRRYGLDLVAGSAHVVPLPVELGKVNGMSCAPDGSLVFTVTKISNSSSTAHRYLYRLDMEGKVSVLAGSGAEGVLLPEDGVPFAEATISGPSSPFVDPAGNVWFSEVGKVAVPVADGGLTQIDVARVMVACVADMQAFGRTFVAGRVYPAVGAGPKTSYSARSDSKDAVDQGDGRPALLATVFKVSSISMLPEGHLVVTDPTLGRLRLLDRETGVIHRLAGPGGAIEPGDVPIALARLALPTYLAADPAGIIWISDFGANKVRRVGRIP